MDALMSLATVVLRERDLRQLRKRTKQTFSFRFLNEENVSNHLNENTQKEKENLV